MTVKLSDIALEAGVSVMTVSNVMNGKSARVSEATARRVRDIADRLGYVANIPARSLATSRSHIIAALIPVEEDNSLLMSPHTVAVIGSLERYLRHRGYHVLLRGIEDAGDIAGATRGWSLDGAILAEFRDEEIDKIDVGNVPLVAIDSYSANPRIISVRTDDNRGGWLAGMHLAGEGHQRLLFAGPSVEGMGVIGQRWHGFRAACLVAGVEEADIETTNVLPTYADGLTLGRRLRREFPHVTGVFATADTLAVGIMAGVTEMGGRIPEDVSIIGFDDVDIAALVTPGLTTIAQDIPGKGELAARLILDEVENGSDHRPPVLLGVTLVDRESVAPPRA